MGRMPCQKMITLGWGGWNLNLRLTHGQSIFMEHMCGREREPGHKVGGWGGILGEAWRPGVAPLSTVDDSQSLEDATLYSRTPAPPSGCWEHRFWSPVVWSRNPKSIGISSL